MKHKTLHEISQTIQDQMFLIHLQAIALYKSSSIFFDRLIQ